MFDTLYSQIGAALIVLVLGFAFLKGEETERIAAGAYGLGWLASMLVQTDANLYSAQWSMMAIDVVMLFVLGGLVWKSHRTWPTWACAAQLLVVTAHVLMTLDVRPPISSYYTVINLAGYGVLVALAVGTFWAWQERRAAGLE